MQFIQVRTENGYRNPIGSSWLGIFCMLLGLLQVGCSRASIDPIVGNWEFGRDGVSTFRADGTGIWSAQNSWGFRWWREENRLVLTLPSSEGGIEESMKVRISSDGTVLSIPPNSDFFGGARHAYRSKREANVDTERSGDRIEFDRKINEIHRINEEP